MPNLSLETSRCPLGQERCAVCFVRRLSISRGIDNNDDDLLPSHLQETRRHCSVLDIHPAPAAPTLPQSPVRAGTAEPSQQHLYQFCVLSSFCASDSEVPASLPRSSRARSLCVRDASTSTAVVTSTASTNIRDILQSQLRKKLWGWSVKMPCALQRLRP